jgi:signal transduction histidine kinase
VAEGYFLILKPLAVGNHTLYYEAGTGLGLFVSKSIVEAHGGKIWASNNTNGNGATFTFTLPLLISKRVQTAEGNI